MAKQDILIRSKKKKAQSLIEAGDFEAARRIYQGLCRANRRDTEAWFTLAALEGRLGNAHGAAECCRHVLAVVPDHVGARYNLGIAMRDLGKTDDAIEAFQRVLALNPAHRDVPPALFHLLTASGRIKEAEDMLRGALGQRPDDPDLHTALGVVLHRLGRLSEAMQSYQRSLALDPTSPLGHDNLGSVLSVQGRYAEALECHRRALECDPGSPTSGSNLLLTLQYAPQVTLEERFEEHRRWGRRHGGHGVEEHRNSREPDRPLRVGYVSPDLHTHSVAYFLEPILANHDPSAVEVYCYSDTANPDETTDRLRALSNRWRSTTGSPDADLDRQIRGDGVDILVDLAGHTARNRLTLFARKPAPLQVTYLGYPDTTGLAAMDYRLSDWTADPAGQERYHTETLVRVPDCFLCYAPPSGAPDVSPLPALTAGHLTFGSFNNLAKVNEDVIALWARLLRDVPSSRLLIKNLALSDIEVRERYWRMFAEHDIGRERVELLGHTPDRTTHLELYGRVDIALDTFPYAGTTTTCEALWMGVPVVTLAREGRHAARVGASLLQALGRPEWVADSPQGYVSIAAALGSDPDSLARLRQGLRSELSASVLCDGEKFARKLEDAYRDIWRRWCEGPSPAGAEGGSGRAD